MILLLLLLLLYTILLSLKRVLVRCNGSAVVVM